MIVALAATAYGGLFIATCLLAWNRNGAHPGMMIGVLGVALSAVAGTWSYAVLTVMYGGEDIVINRVAFVHGRRFRPWARTRELLTDVRSIELKMADEEPFLELTTKDGKLKIAQSLGYDVAELGWLAKRISHAITTARETDI